MTENTTSQIITEIAQKTGKSEEEISALIEAKKEKFSGLLTEQGAVFIVQKELGLRKETLEQIPINQVTEGMKGIEIKGTIEAIYPIKEFDKNGKKGKLKSFILGDGTGEVRATLWNDQVDIYNLTRGSEIVMSNIIASKYNEKTQVTLGFNGTINVISRKEEAFEKISE
ncbi:MAG: hypothetical protein NTY48_07180, partial [Candidatus Diapherotrites archaeon]|nr:hypothetical protein [Candidatus Diapherotrites archaeon]